MNDSNVQNMYAVCSCTLTYVSHVLTEYVTVYDVLFPNHIYIHIAFYVVCAWATSKEKQCTHL